VGGEDERKKRNENAGDVGGAGCEKEEDVDAEEEEVEEEEVEEEEAEDEEVEEEEAEDEEVQEEEVSAVVLLALDRVI
jgi:hypothetical protein